MATLPDGTTKWLIYIKDWDFRWQHVYRYVTPFALPKGTTIALGCTFNKSADDAATLNSQRGHVSWGQWSRAEGSSAIKFRSDGGVVQDLQIAIVARQHLDPQVAHLVV